MTDRLEKGVHAVRRLPADRQDIAGDLLLAIAGVLPGTRLTADQAMNVERAVAEADRGDFPSSEEMQRIWAKLGA